MYKIVLINMPFADVRTPSLALTQLKTVLEKQCSERVSVELLYLNHDFAHYMEVEFYQHIALSGECLISGLGDWIFRHLAFPEAPDNSEEYFMRYYPHQDERTQRQKKIILAKKHGMASFVDKLIDRYRIDKADLVGFTSTFSQSVACYAMSKRLKDRNSNVVTIMGGTNCQWPMGEEIARNVPQIDFVFSGPALINLVGFVQQRLDKDPDGCNRIDGVFSKTNRVSRSCGANPQIGMITTLSRRTEHKRPSNSNKALNASVDYVNIVGDELEINADIELDYEQFLDSFENDFPNMTPKLLFETSRGCWWGEKLQCTFCGTNGLAMKYRAMEPETAIRQFQRLFKYGSRCKYYFCTDCIMQRTYVDEVLPFLEPPDGVVLGYEVKADLDEKQLAVMSRAGVKYIQPGIEALSTSSLKLMKKGSTAFGNIRFLKNCLISEVYPGWNILVGFPGEEESVYEKYVRDLPLLRHLPPPTGVYPVRFDRYSSYFQFPEKYGLDLQPYDFYGLVYPFKEESLANMAYYFSDENIDEAQYFVNVSKWYQMIKAECDSWRRSWFADCGDIPMLYISDDGKCVVDSRSGQMKIHDIGSEARDLLEHLGDKPKGMADIYKVWNKGPGKSAEKAVDTLTRLGLVFQERGLFMSLAHKKRVDLNYFCKLREAGGFDL